MKVRALKPKIQTKLESFGLTKTYIKQVQLFEENPRHPSLHYEILEGSRQLNPCIRSFRLNKKFRVLGYELGNEFQPINITKHYQ